MNSNNNIDSESQTEQEIIKIAVVHKTEAERIEEAGGKIIEKILENPFSLEGKLESLHIQHELFLDAFQKYKNEKLDIKNIIILHRLLQESEDTDKQKYFYQKSILDGILELKIQYENSHPGVEYTNEDFCIWLDEEIEKIEKQLEVFTKLIQDAEKRNNTLTEELRLQRG